jgi:DNA-binding NarL/FixJ family response regulator
VSAPKSVHSQNVNVLISDGHKLVREGIAMLLEKDALIRVVGEAQDAGTAATLIGPLGAQVVLLIMPTTGSAVLMGGTVESDVVLAAVRDLHAARVPAKLIVLTPAVSSPDLRQLVRAGAVGCLTMDCTSEELIAAVRHAVGGGRGDVYLSSRLREQLARRYVTSTADAEGAVRRGVGDVDGGGGDGADGRLASLARAPRLASRETEVLRLIAAGQSTKEIAVALNVGTKTVETHRRRVMEKLNRHSVAELTQYAIIKGLIQLPREVES